MKRKSLCACTAVFVYPNPSCSNYSLRCCLGPDTHLRIDGRQDVVFTLDVDFIPTHRLNPALEDLASMASHPHAHPH